MAHILQVGGTWSMHQTNGYTVNLNLTQHETSVTGTANTRGMSSNNVSGKVDDHSIDLEIPWTSGSVGIYHGENTQNKFALPGGYFTGHTEDRTHPGSKAEWSSNGLNLPW